ncbi:PcfJ domain-containing protein [Pseudomonas aeruginosa]|uniref:PcfJ domain-containing protein n=1 Tax=Pseudomonas aeruginosa TaxID=287 RepID=UPI001F179A77|nr:PcfJ domain-containing protein [Pseudomonas aeruginosa]MCR3874114.1 PcfJ domain-containing protein [Pseudomonas aeruginosa]
MRVAPLDNAPPSGPLQDPSLARYSERQLAVANTWATHFSLAGTARTKFIHHYLRSTSTTRCWCITVYAAYNAIPWQIHNAKPDYNRLFNGCPSDWQDPAWLAITARLRDIKEFYTALDQGNSQFVRQARSVLQAYLGHCTYRQAGNLVDDYHQVQRELRATVQSSLPDLVDTDEYTTWEGMLPVGLIDCPNGLQIVELRCPADLYAEHIALAHCIDSYDQAAYRGECRLLSVREAGRPLASAELELRREHGEPLGRPWNPQHLSTVQLREFDNAPVPADSPAGQAYRWFMERIRSGAIATNLNWPDMTVHMTRFADGRWKAGLAEATAKWLLTRLENR